MSVKEKASTTKASAAKVPAKKMTAEKDEALNGQYWDTFYKQNLGHLPSQFCVSVLTDANPDSAIVELGSGNGRDSHYFASQGRITAAMDISAEGIKSCESYAAKAEIRHSIFAQGDITAAADLASLISAARARAESKPLTFYSRFVMHALNDEQEQKFLHHLANEAQPGEQVFFEFRSKEDAELKKTFGGHYRRFIDTDAFVAQLTDNLGFDLEYRVTGTGMAKYKDEDPVVSRVIVRKR